MEGKSTFYFTRLICPFADYFQAKLNSLHEVVVRNRLEQLRKRQRDEALQAQNELLAGVAKSASRTWGGDMTAEAVPEREDIPKEEDVEEYERSMSPALLDIKKLSYDDRQIKVVSEKDDIENLVSKFVKLGGLTYVSFFAA